MNAQARTLRKNHKNGGRSGPALMLFSQRLRHERYVSVKPVSYLLTEDG
jgi:hypothetical protein